MTEEQVTFLKSYSYLETFVITNEGDTDDCDTILAFFIKSQGLDKAEVDKFLMNLND